MRFHISVKTVKGDDLNFTVESYKVKEGLVIFIDKKTNKLKKFPLVRCDIEEVD